MSDSAENVEWYLARDGEQHGPLNPRELDKFIELGHLRPTDLLWRAGFDDWRGAAEVFPPRPPPGPKLPPIGAQPPHATATGNNDTFGDGRAQHERDDWRGKEANRHREVSEDRREPVLTRPTGGQHSAGATSGGATDPAAQGLSGDALAGAHREHGARGGARGEREAHGSDRHLDRDARHIRDGNTPRNVEQERVRDQRPQHIGDQTTLRMQRTEHGRGEAGRGEAGLGHAGPAMQRGTAGINAAPSDLNEDAFLDDEPGQRSGWLTVAAALFVFVILGAGGLFAYNNQGAIVDFYNGLASKKSSNDIAVVRAPQEAIRELAASVPVRVQAPPRVLPETPEAARSEQPLPELPILRSKLWQFAQREFGDWTKERLAFVKQLSEQEKPKEEVNQYLVDAFVKFRRDNAAVALLASSEKLGQVAQAFVESLRALTEKGPQACYAFISNGESTPEVAPLYFEPETAGKLEAQMLAIMQAIVDGRSSPDNSRKPPSASDFNMLSEELGKRGWNAADLQLFSDPNALSRAKPEVVCRLVTEWFATQTELADRVTRDQLIAASLRPVIGG